MTKYTDRTAVVTGGAHGTGLAVAKRLVEGGARVLVTARDPAALPGARTELGRGAHLLADGATPLTETVAARLGHIDHLFVHAGSPDTSPHTAAAEARATLDALLPLLTPRGSVVLSGCPATQSALRVCAQEAAARGVRVNTVAAGHDDDLMQRRGSADEAARAALFLATEAPFTTGTELPVDVMAEATEVTAGPETVTTTAMPETTATTAMPETTATTAMPETTATTAMPETTPTTPTTATTARIEKPDKPDKPETTETTARVAKPETAETTATTAPAAKPETTATVARPATPPTSATPPTPSAAAAAPKLSGGHPHA
ncbi:SDR family NAD(P)-dependent oxidoreductase [Streptomyces sp. NPDC006552]|uniref:SDR family NAD(P)-dependent oxidoreductase n=1 Tax=Streptomyces sp. NPDC006552 TaxID=3157179 RepID=UPI0033BB78E7